MPLFHRHARGLILTEQGELLYRTAHEVFMKLEAARTKLTDSREHPNGDLQASPPRRASACTGSPRGSANSSSSIPTSASTLIVTDEELDLVDARGRRRHPHAPAGAARPDPAQALHGALPRLCVARISQALRHAAQSLDDLDNHRILLLGGGPVPSYLREPQLAGRGRRATAKVRARRCSRSITCSA